MYGSLPRNSMERMCEMGGKEKNGILQLVTGLSSMLKVLFVQKYRKRFYSA